MAGLGEADLLQSLTYGNGLILWKNFTADNEVYQIVVEQGTTTIMNRFQSRTDKVNIDRVSDALVPANDEVLTYTDAGRLASAPATDTLRFPGQYYQLEDGLAYNWHRSYDASLGRYTQPDPLGFVDGPSVYEYAGQSPLMMVDPTGEVVPLIIGLVAGFAFDAGLEWYKRRNCKCNDTGFELGSVGNAALGGALGATGSFESKPRTGVAGGGRSGARSSVASRLNHGAARRGWYSNRARNAITRGLRRVPYLGLALGAGQLYAAYNCD
jgi:RHS repeat-associated protein